MGMKYSTFVIPIQPSATLAGHIKNENENTDNGMKNTLIHITPIG
jgi:hypothetical protein